MTHEDAAETVHLFDPFDARLAASPYAAYDRVRAAAPIYWYQPLRCWVMTRKEDVQAVLSDVNFVALESSKIVSDLARRAGRNYEPIVRALDAVLFFKDGPRHRHERRTIAQILNRTSLRQLEPHIERIVSDFAAKLSGATEYDAIEAFADPIPQFVMAHILDLPGSDVPILGQLLSQLTRIFEPATLDVYDLVNRGLTDAFDLLKARIAQAARENPSSALAFIYEQTSGTESDRLTDAAATTMFAYRVGSETTTGLIGMIVHTLIRQPSLRQVAQDDPAKIPAIVSEVLRLESTVQRSVRVAGEAREIGGKMIGAGERVLLLLGAANRDPEAFERPNELLLDRTAGSDVTFGAGHHFCLGASLTRLEGRIALEHLLKLPAIEQAAEEEWYLGRFIRRLVRLPVRVLGNK